jgi:hypothetical protein
VTFRADLSLFWKMDWAEETKSVPPTVWKTTYNVSISRILVFRAYRHLQSAMAVAAEMSSLADTP